MDAEKMLKELRLMLKDRGEDPGDIRSLTLRHALDFLSSERERFQAYLDNQRAMGAFDDFGR